MVSTILHEEIFLVVLGRLRWVSWMMKALLWSGLTNITPLFNVCIMILHLYVWKDIPFFHFRIWCLSPLWSRPLSHLRFFLLRVRVRVRSMIQWHLTVHHFLIWPYLWLTIGDPFAIHHQNEVPKATNCIFKVIGWLSTRGESFSWALRHALVENAPAYLDASVYITLCTTWHQGLNHF